MASVCVVDSVNYCITKRSFLKIVRRFSSALLHCMLLKCICMVTHTAAAQILLQASVLKPIILIFFRYIAFIIHLVISFVRYILVFQNT
jgi:hypothetical protein